jgi:uncharacterized protein (TIGR03435 family)
MRKIALGIGLALTLSAQPRVRAVFKTATIQRSDTGHPAERTAELQDGSLTLRSVSLREIIAVAFHLEVGRVSGPAWVNVENYDVIADSGDHSPEPRVREMLQALLADRLKLESHRENRNVPAYVLKKGPDSPKLEPVPAGGTIGITVDRVGLVFRGYSMQLFASYLSAFPNALPVKDETGIAGSFNFAVAFPDRLTKEPNIQDAVANLMADRSVPRLIVEGIGLKLEDLQQPVEFLVIDRIEKSPGDR